MSGQPQPGPTGRADAFFAALTAGAAERPESRVLDRLVGEWHVHTEWEPVVGAGIQRSEGHVTTRWTFGGRVLETRSSDADGTETALLLCAFDPTAGDYVAFTVNVYSTYFILERGHYDADAGALIFDGEEPLPGDRPDVHFRRTFTFPAGEPDRYSISISYPDVPPGTYGPMSGVHERRH